MRFAFLFALAGLSACGGSNQVASSTPITEAAEPEVEAAYAEHELDLFAMQEEACNQPGARTRDIVIDGITFHCFAN